MIGQWDLRGPQVSRFIFLLFDVHLIGKQSLSWCHCFLGILMMLLEREKGLKLSCPFKSILFTPLRFTKPPKLNIKLHVVCIHQHPKITLKRQQSSEFSCGFEIFILCMLILWRFKQINSKKKEQSLSLQKCRSKPCIGSEGTDSIPINKHSKVATSLL